MSKVIKTEIFPFGSLKVRATEMISLPWERIRRKYEVDGEGNMKISMNLLLVDTGNRVVLFDPGCADFLPSRVEAEYGLEINKSLEQILNCIGYSPEQVTDVIFTHLHFDHGSGAFIRIPGRIVKRFPQADYHVLKEHFLYASGPAGKKSGEFITRFFKHVDKIHWLEDWDREWMDFRVYNGHTREMVVPRIITPKGDLYYVSDLIPMEIFLDPDAASGYDLDPELARREKRDFLKTLDQPCELVLYHDPVRKKIIYPEGGSL
ncbi:MAG: MBL fold metallo-hydrolase [Bacteroidales bacterium]